ncbi:hypothetical protein ON010_g18658 [Phytophthora cinnamomi]|nr:hypothetical protein ON010_g18658 [Phytophthora cinnamomi]
MHTAVIWSRSTPIEIVEEEVFVRALVAEEVDEPDAVVQDAKEPDEVDPALQQVAAPPEACRRARQRKQQHEAHVEQHVEQEEKAAGPRVRLAPAGVAQLRPEEQHEAYTEVDGSAVTCSSVATSVTSEHTRSVAATNNSR